MSSQIRILIVDDSDVFVDTLIYLIKQVACNKVILIDKCYNGIDTINKVKNNSYDYIFMDVNLPDMSGIELTKLISVNNRFVHIIAISFCNDMFSVRKMLEAGAKNYLIKDELNKFILKNLLCKTNY